MLPRVIGRREVGEFSVGAGKAFRSEGSHPLDDNASFHGRRRLQRWGRTPRVFRHDQSRKEKSYPKCTISELQSNVQRHNCSHVHDQTLAGTLASFIIHHLTCLRVNCLTELTTRNSGKKTRFLDWNSEDLEGTVGL